MHCGKLFEQDIHMLDRRMVAVYGINENYKATLLQHLYSFYKSNNNNILYFKDDDKSLVSKEMIDMYCLLSDLNNTGIKNTLESIEYAYDMVDRFALEELQVGSLIRCGYIQLLNYIFSINLNDHKDLIVIIENFGSHFHSLVKRKFLHDLNSCGKIKQVVFTIYDKFNFDIPISSSEFCYINSDKLFKKNVNKNLITV